MALGGTLHDMLEQVGTPSRARVLNPYRRTLIPWHFSTRCAHTEALRSRSLAHPRGRQNRLLFVQLLGDGWTVEVNNAWAAAWNVIENHMVAIAQSARKRLVD